MIKTEKSKIWNIFRAESTASVVNTASQPHAALNSNTSNKTFKIPKSASSYTIKENQLQLNDQQKQFKKCKLIIIQIRRVIFQCVVIVVLLLPFSISFYIFFFIIIITIMLIKASQTKTKPNSKTKKCFLFSFVLILFLITKKNLILIGSIQWY